MKLKKNIYMFLSFSFDLYFSFLPRLINIRYICSAKSRNRDNSRIVLDKVRILTVSGDVGIPTWHGSIPESSLRKVGIGTK